MAEKQSNAAAEREAAQRAMKNGLQERESYTAKQVAIRCGTDSKTMRKFFRSSHSTVEPVGQGGRYEFDAKDLPKIRKEFNAWTKRAQANSTRKPTPPPKLEPQQIIKAAADTVAEDPEEDFTLEQVADAIERAQEQETAAFEKLAEDGLIWPKEPTEEDLAELEDEELD